MKWVDLAPKYIYFLGLTLNICILIFFVFLNTKAIESGQLIPILIIGLMSSTSLFYFLFYINKYVFVAIDNESNKIVFGGLLFKQEIAMSKFQGLKKVPLLKNLYSIRLDGNKYFFYSNPISKDLRQAIDLLEQR